MKLSCFINILALGSGPMRYLRRCLHRYVAETRRLEKLAALDIKAVDISPSMQRTSKAKAALQALDLEVACMALSHEAPSGAAFDSEDPDCADQMVRHTHQALDHAAEIGAGWAYILPPSGDDRSLRRYAEQCAALAERGKQLGVKVCIEHVPETALPTVQATLDFIRDVDHPNLYLLFDLGHAQITKEDPAKVLPLAGHRLAYIHLDYNDGERDLHQALTDGVQTSESLAGFFRVLEELGYKGPLCLELSASLPDPLDAICRSRQIVERYIDIERDRSRPG